MIWKTGLEPKERARVSLSIRGYSIFYCIHHFQTTVCGLGHYLPSNSMSLFGGKTGEHARGGPSGQIMSCWVPLINAILVSSKNWRFLKIIFATFMSMFVWLCMCNVMWVQCPFLHEKGVWFSRTGVRSSCQSPDTRAGTQALALSKNSKSS